MADEVLKGVTVAKTAKELARDVQERCGRLGLLNVLKHKLQRQLRAIDKEWLELLEAAVADDDAIPGAQKKDDASGT